MSRSAVRSPPARTVPEQETSRLSAGDLRRSSSSARTGRSAGSVAATKTSTAPSSSLGALGLVTRVSLDVVPAFELRQYVFEQLPWSTVETDLDAILEGGYSVSLFTMWDEPAIGQVWVKTTEQLDPRSSYFGAAPATQPRHPVPGATLAELHGAARRAGPLGRAAAALPPRLHSQQRRRAPVGVRRGAQSTAPTRFANCDASPRAVSPLLLTRRSGRSPRTRSGSARSTSRTASRSTSPGSRSSTTCSPCCRRSRARSSRSACDRTGGSCSRRRRKTSRPSTRSCRTFRQLRAEARRRRQVPQRVHRALRRLKQPLSRECRPSRPGAARSVPPRRGRARRSSRRRRARARSRTARSSP